MTTFKDWSATQNENTGLPANNLHRYPVFTKQKIQFEYVYGFQGFFDVFLPDHKIGQAIEFFVKPDDSVFNISEEEMALPLKIETFFLAFERKACIEPFEEDRNYRSECWILVCEEKNLKHLYRQTLGRYQSFTSMFGETRSMDSL